MTTNYIISQEQRIFNCICCVIIQETFLYMQVFFFFSWGKNIEFIFILKSKLCRFENGPEFQKSSLVNVFPSNVVCGNSLANYKQAPVLEKQNKIPKILQDFWEAYKPW